jgi:hypothetical protein
MLDILSHGSPHFCDALSRRKAMQIGALGTLGLGLPQMRAAAAPSETSDYESKTFGQAKRVILLYMWGGPAHQDTWDLKPNGPVNLRGEFLPISTNVPGMHISEHFPLIAQQADKLAILRSVGQEDNNHSTGAHAGLTGRRHELKAENFGARDSDFPHYGSVLSKLRPHTNGMPSFVALPDIIATTAGKITPGQGGGKLGKKYDPFHITDHPDEPGFSISTLKVPGSLSTLRMQNRRSLLEQIDTVARMSERSSTAQAVGDFYQQALDMVLSPQARQAFDLASVPDEERWRYGWHTFGQSVLMARRLIESGVQLVTVYWHREVKTVDSSWDTHALNFQELKNRLMPSVDRPIAALLEDLEAKGLLDETLVIWNSEFGRTPKINANAGRDHWGPCNSVVMAGGGIPGGQVFGATDKAAAYPTADKVTQDDIAATIYHLLGFAPDTLIYDNVNRPYPVALGTPIFKMLGEECKPNLQPNPPQHVSPPQIGDFHRMLKERARRYICCEFGNLDGEKDWKLTGWSNPSGEEIDRNRVAGKTVSTIKYLGMFYGHFNYSHAVIRLAEPKMLDGVTFTVNATPIAIPQELLNSKAKIVWQIPFPQDFLKTAKSFEAKLFAPDWPVTSFALVGDAILDMHLAHYNV